MVKYPLRLDRMFHILAADRAKEFPPTCNLIEQSVLECVLPAIGWRSLFLGSAESLHA